jgi:hypothetical protein
MGLLSRLFKIPSFEGATNALLVELTLPTLTDAQRAELKIRVIEVFQKIGPSDLSPDAALLDLNQASRLTQLNFLALANWDSTRRSRKKSSSRYRTRSTLNWRMSIPCGRSPGD